MGIENSINVIFVGWVSYVHEKIASPAKYPNNPVDPFPGYPPTSAKNCEVIPPC